MILTSPTRLYIVMLEYLSSCCSRERMVRTADIYEGTWVSTLCTFRGGQLLREDGSVMCDGIADVSSNNNHSLLLTRNGEVYGRGHNEYGQLGLDEIPDTLRTHIPTKERAVSFTTGPKYSVVITSNGKAYATGNNFYGQLGVGDRICRFVWTPISLDQFVITCATSRLITAFLTRRGQVYVCGHRADRLVGGSQGDRIQPMRIPTSSRITLLVATYHGFALTLDDGEVVILTV